MGNGMVTVTCPVLVQLGRRLGEKRGSEMGEGWRMKDGDGERDAMLRELFPSASPVILPGMSNNPKMNEYHE